MGHHSVAEHAVFNFDIIGVSRLAIEEIERFRLNSYTEKSQRYITLGDDFVLPEEIKTTKYQRLFTDTTKLQNDNYHVFYNKLKEYVFNKYTDLSKDPKKHNLLDGWAKEDARYVLPSATTTQMIVSMNAHSLIDFFVRRLCTRAQLEITILAEEMLNEVKKVSPVIFKDLGAYCEFYGYCPENDHSCGREKTLQQIKDNQK